MQFMFQEANYSGSKAIVSFGKPIRDMVGDDRMDWTRIEKTDSVPDLIRKYAQYMMFC